MKIPFKLLSMLLASAVSLTVQASPVKDLELFRDYFKKKFPNIEQADYADGIYAIDMESRQNWEAIEEFPPYEPYIDEGKVIWETPFKNGKTYKDCFPDGPAMSHKYPYWDKENKMVMTLALAVNKCREANGEEPLDYVKSDISILNAYIVYQARGKIVNTIVPDDDPDALAAYEAGKKFYFTRRGQLNYSCATCHFQNTGLRIRHDIMGPALGHTTHFPTYRSNWGTIGPLHRRFARCNWMVRAKPFDLQSEQYRNLEYFMSYMSNGLPFNGPGARK